MVTSAGPTEPSPLDLADGRDSRQPELSLIVDHVVTYADNGPFHTASCECGWQSFARRSRPLARREGGDHLLLHAPPGPTPDGPPPST